MDSSTTVWYDPVMKMTVSVPDDLWAAVHDPAAGRSATVQLALQTLLERKREEEKPMARAPSSELRLELEEDFQRSVEGAARVIARARSQGYRMGVRFAAGMTLTDFEFLDADPDRFVEEVRQVVVYGLPDSKAPGLVLSGELWLHIGELAENLELVPDDGDEMLVEIGETEDYGVRYLTDAELSAMGYVSRGEGRNRPYLMPDFCDGMVAAFEDVRAEAIRRMRSDEHRS